jgi:hypothetical protein
MNYNRVTKEQVEQSVSKAINETEAELRALKAITINVEHKKLTNKAVQSELDDVSVRVGDYVVNKALYISYRSYNRYLISTTIAAYAYEDEQGNSLGSIAGLKTSRTLTPTELQDSLDKVIEGRKELLSRLKSDLVAAQYIVDTYNDLNGRMNELLKGLTSAVTTVLK